MAISLRITLFYFNPWKFMIIVVLRINEYFKKTSVVPDAFLTDFQT